MKKRIISLLVSIILLVGQVQPIIVSAESVTGKCGDNLIWTLDNTGTLTISGTGAMYDYGYDPLAPWYSVRTSVKVVVIKDGVNSIGNFAFWECCNLTSVSIPDSVASVGWGAFSDCASLIYNEYGNTEYLGNATNPYLVLLKASSRSITSVNIHNSTKIIGDDAFYFCTNLTSVTIPNSVTTIGNSAFQECTNLTSITIPNSVVSIMGEAFCNCHNLRTVNYIGTKVQWDSIVIEDGNTDLTYATIHYNSIFDATESVPTDAKEYNGHYYKVYTDVCNTWEEAKAYCERLGGYLAVISSAEENAELYSYISSCGYKNAYFGFSDSIEEKNGSGLTTKNQVIQIGIRGNPIANVQTKITLHSIGNTLMEHGTMAILEKVPFPIVVVLSANGMTKYNRIYQLLILSLPQIIPA